MASDRLSNEVSVGMMALFIAAHKLSHVSSKTGADFLHRVICVLMAEGWRLDPAKPSKQAIRPAFKSFLPPLRQLGPRAQFPRTAYISLSQHKECRTRDTLEETVRSSCRGRLKLDRARENGARCAPTRISSLLLNSLAGTSLGFEFHPGLLVTGNRAPLLRA